MSCFLLPGHTPQPLRDSLIRVTIAETGAQVVFSYTEQAGADFAVSGQPDPVAVTTEGFAHGGYDAKLATSVGKAPAS